VHILLRIKDRLKLSVIGPWYARRKCPNIGRPFGEVRSATALATLVVVVGPDFSYSTPNAATKCRLGWCHGAEAIGLAYHIVSATELACKLPDIPNPICWIAGSDYIYLDKHNLRALRDCRHLVWVPTKFRGEIEYYRAMGAPLLSAGPALMKKILSSEPQIVFTISPESSFEYYEEWIQAGVRFVSLPLACDSRLYQYDPGSPVRFPGVEIAFVGGYWEYKARQLDLYLKRFNEHLTVAGYSSWPYGHYIGQLADPDEKILYRNAKVSPVINEPHVSRMGVDLNERVFKVMATGGMAVTDATPAYREWFSPEELLVPHSVDEFREMIVSIIREPSTFDAIRARGREAVESRHTYKHRVARVCEFFDIHTTHYRPNANDIR